MSTTNRFLGDSINIGEVVPGMSLRWWDSSKDVLCEGVVVSVDADGPVGLPVFVLMQKDMRTGGIVNCSVPFADMAYNANKKVLYKLPWNVRWGDVIVPEKACSRRWYTFEEAFRIAVQHPIFLLQDKGTGDVRSCHFYLYEDAGDVSTAVIRTGAGNHLCDRENFIKYRVSFDNITWEDLGVTVHAV